MDTMNTHARRHAVLLAAALMLATHRAHADDMANMPGMDTACFIKVHGNA